MYEEYLAIDLVARTAGIQVFIYKMALEEREEFLTTIISVPS